MSSNHRVVINLTTLMTAVLAIAACGRDDGPRPAAATPQRDALVATHDEFVTCVQKHDELGLTVRYRDGQAVASTGEGHVRGKFDDRVSAPGAIGALVERGAAQYVGLRSGTGPDLDVLILPSPADAEAAAARIAGETGRSPGRTGAFVTVPLTDADAPGGTPAALDRCIAKA